LSGKAAADLQQLNAKGELSANWKKNVEEKFATLNDDNAVYYMLLEAIQCQSGKDKNLARSMFTTLETEMKARRGARARARSSRTVSNELPGDLKAKRDATFASFQ
jgi:hypothetical protein